MSITKFNIGNDFVRDENGKTMFPKSGYTPAVGDAVVLDNSIANGFDLCAANENAWGRVDWVSPDASYACVRELVPGTMAVWPTSGSVAIGDKTEATGAIAATGTGGQNASVMRTDNTPASAAFEAWTPVLQRGQAR